MTAVAAAGSVCLALAAAHLIGYAHFRPRPFAGHAVTLLLGRSPDPSFPSDHATFAFAMIPVLWWKSRRGRWPLLAAGVVLAFSRVYCGTHYPGDVVGGAFLGLLSGLPFLRWRATATGKDAENL